MKLAEGNRKERILQIHIRCNVESEHALLKRRKAANRLKAVPLKIMKADGRNEKSSLCIGESNLYIHAGIWRTHASFGGKVAATATLAQAPKRADHTSLKPIVAHCIRRTSMVFAHLGIHLV